MYNGVGLKNLMFLIRKVIIDSEYDTGSKGFFAHQATIRSPTSAVPEVWFMLPRSYDLVLILF